MSKFFHLFDLSGMETIVTSLHDLGRTIMLVSQYTEINSLSENTIIIQK